MVTGQCKFTPNAAVCDDANPCTVADACTAGACKGTAKVCDDKNPCTTDSCNSTGACVATALADGVACSDGNLCTVGDVCLGTQCASKAKCNDANPCTVDTCNAVTGACSVANLADGATCTDVDACTGNDACTAGKCAGAKGGACGPLVEATFACNDAGTWAVSPAVQATQTGWQIDGNPSPPAWHSPGCSLNFNNGMNFACAPGATKVTGTATSPTWDATGAKDVVLEFYSFANVGTNLYVNKRWVEASTDDFQTLAMTVGLPNEATVNKAWIYHKFDATVLAGKTFKVRTRFDSVNCTATAAQGWFVDDLRITVDLAKPCTSDSDCADASACSDNACSNGACGLAWSTTATACEDGNACTTGDKCNGAGVCVAGGASLCNDSNPCTADSCNPVVGCVFTNTDGVACTDNNACTASDACKTGKCVPGANAALGTACNDGEICTSPDTCTSGVCAGKNACEDGNACTVDLCTKVSASVKACANNALAENAACDDGSACTAGDSCVAGKCASYSVCSGGFSDSFPCGDNGDWTFSASSGKNVAWKIDGLPTPLSGGASAWKSPSCSLNFNNDVNFESGTTSVGSATSAAFTVPASAAAELDFWSYFDSEQGSYDQKFVEVLDAATGAILSSTKQGSAGATKWALIKIPLGAGVQGKKVRLRFRFDSKDYIANSGTGWFVDDVVVLPASAACSADAECADDGNPCTDSVCLDGGCAQKPGSEAKVCDDANPCTTASACGGGLCKGTAMLACTDNYACTTDTCVPGKGCLFTPDPSPTCNTVALPYTQTFTCDDASTQLWQADLAQTGSSWAVDGTPNPPGFQSPGCSLNFNDGKDDSCGKDVASVDASAKSPLFDATTVKAGSALTLQFALNGQWDAAPTTSLELDISLDGKAWTTLKSYGPQDAWTPFAISLNGFAGKKFQVRFHFTVPACKDLVAASGPFIDDFKLFSPNCKTDGDCTDGNGCTADTCDVGLCAFKPTTVPCDDNNPCTGGDLCGSGKCAGILKTCDDGNGCTADACDLATGQCGFVSKSDGTLCTDGNPCSAGDACLAGQCVGKIAALDGSKCSDGNGCTTGDACLSGQCKPAGFAAEGGLCSDGNPCTAGDACKNGGCLAGKAACDDGKACTLDACTAIDATTKTCATSPVSDGTACDDGDLCTTVDACKSGTCLGTGTCP